MGNPEGRARAVAVYDPGEDACDRYPEWVIRHRAIGVPEVMDVRARVILIERGATRGERRSSLAHAVAHLDLGHVVIGGHLGSNLADAIRWHGQSWSHVAEALDVDDRMLGVWPPTWKG